MSPHSRNKKVTLVHSGEKGGYLHIPLSILYLAAALIENGYEPHLVDLRIENLRPKDIDGALFLGVSHMTGAQQIPPALNCARISRNQGVPVVFGGTHPSILPEQTAAHPLVDIAVKGEGEEVIVELAEYFRGERDLSKIKGIAYKNGSGDPVYTGDRKPPSFNRTTHLPYHLLPMDKYSATTTDFGFQSSRGCPHRCAFCAEISLFQRTWRAKPADVIVEEIEGILSRFSPRRICFVDSNFFCNQRRVREFCELIIARGIKTEFFGECRFDYFVKYDTEFLNLLKRAGFREIEFGGESGSDKTLEFIRKDITRDIILKGITKCREHGIRSFTSFMLGFPTEDDLEMYQTLDIVDRIGEIDSKGARINGLFIYSPFPGTALYDLVVEKHGFEPPRDLEQWGLFELYNANNITWHGSSKKRQLQIISILQRYFFTYNTLRNWNWAEKVRRHRGFIKALLSTIFNSALLPFARIRWKKRWFSYALEWRVWNYAFTKFMGRK